MTKTVKRPQKRYGHHQKQTSHFLKTYWPYMPLTLIISSMLLLSAGMHRVGRGVLSYATSVTAQRLLIDTNQQRSDNNVAALKLNDELSAAAQAKANDMAARNYWAHNTPDGNPPWVFIDKAGYHYEKAGENLAYGFANSDDTVVGWMNSPPHRENLLDSSFSDVGFGYANVQNYQNKGPETIVVAMYGEPRISLAPSPITSTPIVSQNSAISTLAAVTSKPSAEPHAQNIAVSEVLAGRQLPWVNALIITVALGGLLVLLLKHSLNLRRTLLKGERFALHHPLFDITVVSFLGLCIMLTHAAGVIR